MIDTICNIPPDTIQSADNRLSDDEKINDILLFCKKYKQLEKHYVIQHAFIMMI